MDFKVGFCALCLKQHIELTPAVIFLLIIFLQSNKNQFSCVFAKKFLSLWFTVTFDLGTEELIIFWEL